ncbi:MAG: hypothetical protein M3Y33_17170 [Actinomycetota bacterium]|nr:hypothetical protein [Actinomycetota bacterium]
MSTSAEHGPRDDLARYVQDALHEQGLSFRRVAVRATDPETGQRLGFQWISKLAGGGLSKAPDPWQLRALAAGLGVPDDAVKELAARQWLDYEVAQVALGDTDWAFYLQARDLPDEDKETLRVLVREFVRRQEGRSRKGTAGEAPA